MHKWRVNCKLSAKQALIRGLEL